MLDSDLAQLYEVPTYRLNEAISRNKARFPDHFMFQLTAIEYEFLTSPFINKAKTNQKMNNYTQRSQIAISGCKNIELESLSFSEKNPIYYTQRSQNKSNAEPTQEVQVNSRELESSDLNISRGSRRYLPRVFTEQGVAMVSAVLKSDVAIQVSIAIMETFVQLRREKLATQNSLADQFVQFKEEVDRKFEKLEKQNQSLSIQNQTILAAIGKIQQTKSHRSIAVLPKNIPSGSIEKMRSKIIVIQSTVAKYFCLKVEDLQIETRRKSISLPRQIAIYLARKQTDLSLKEIAFLYGKDHSTIFHACEKIETKMKEDSEFKEVVESILNLIH